MNKLLMGSFLGAGLFLTACETTVVPSPGGGYVDGGYRNGGYHDRGYHDGDGHRRAYQDTEVNRTTINRTTVNETNVNQRNVRQTNVSERNRSQAKPSRNVSSGRSTAHTSAEVHAHPASDSSVTSPKGKKNGKKKGAGSSND